MKVKELISLLKNFPEDHSITLHRMVHEGAAEQRVEGVRLHEDYVLPTDKSPREVVRISVFD